MDDVRQLARTLLQYRGRPSKKPNAVTRYENTDPQYDPAWVATICLKRYHNNETKGEVAGKIRKGLMTLSSKNRHVLENTEHIVDATLLRRMLISAAKQAEPNGRMTITFPPEGPDVSANEVRSEAVKIIEDSLNNMPDELLANGPNDTSTLASVVQSGKRPVRNTAAAAVASAMLIALFDYWVQTQFVGAAVGGKMLDAAVGGAAIAGVSAGVSAARR